MKFFVITLCLFSSLLTWSSEGQTQISTNKIVLSYCSNFGDGVSFSFSSCVNSNFQRLQRELGGFYSYCSNIGDEVNFSFTNCIQSNFRSAERNADGSLYLNYCTNFDRTRLSFSYVSCVNNNFRSIETYLRKQ
jgi:hypothetical protein